MLIAIILYEKFKNKSMIKGFLISIYSTCIMFGATIIPYIFLAVYSFDILLLKKQLIYNVVLSINNIVWCYLISRLFSHINTNITELVELAKKIQKIGYTIVLNISIIFVFLLIFVFLNSRKIGNQIKMDIINISMITLFITYVIFSGYIFLKIIKAETQKLSALTELAVNQRLYETTIKMNNDIENFKHDQLKIYSSMKIFIDEARNQELKTYFYDNLLPMQKNICEQKNETIEIEKILNIPLKSVIQTSLLKAFEFDIYVSIEVNEGIDEINMSAIDLCRVVGIFIDNAIEETINSSNKQILICIIKEDDGMFFVIKNTCTSHIAINSVFRRGATTKQKNQGLGLSIVKSIVSSNENVNLNTYYENNFFIQELFIENK